MPVEPDVIVFVNNYYVFRKCALPMAKEYVSNPSIAAVILGKKEKIVWAFSGCSLIAGYSSILSLSINKRYKLAIFLVSGLRKFNIAVLFLTFLFYSLLGVKTVWVPSIGGVFNSPSGLLKGLVSVLRRRAKSSVARFIIKLGIIFQGKGRDKGFKQGVGKKILIVIEMSGLGDFVATTAAMRVIDANFPEHQINCLCWGKFKDIGRCVPWVDLWHCDGDYIDYGILDPGFALALKRGSFEYIFLFGSKSFLGTYADFLRNTQVFHLGKPRQGIKVHGRINFSQLYLNSLSLNGFKALESNPQLFIPEEVLNDTEAFLRKEGIAEGQPFIIVVPGPDSVKSWPLDRYLGVTQHISSKLGYRVVICGADNKDELSKSQRLENRIGPSCINLCARLNESQFSAVVKKAKLIVCNDSSPGHIAFAVSTPAVVIYGPTDPALFGYDHPAYKAVRSRAECSPCSGRCILPNSRCLEEVSADMVIKAMEGLLGKG